MLVVVSQTVLAVLNRDAIVLSEYPLLAGDDFYNTTREQSGISHHVHRLCCQICFKLTERI